jgi:hypothetical protein
MSEDAFLRKYAAQIDWYRASSEIPLSEALIRDFFHLINWNGVSQRQVLSIQFVRDFKSDLVMCANLKQCIQKEHIRSTLELALLPEISSKIAEFL